MGMNDKEKLISAAIAKEVKVEFDYGGKTTLDPYLLGFSSMGDTFLYGKTWHSDGEHFYIII